jgi:hypothetical protein
VHRSCIQFISLFFHICIVSLQNLLLSSFISLELKNYIVEQHWTSLKLTETSKICAFPGLRAHWDSSWSVRHILNYWWKMTQGRTRPDYAMIGWRKAFRIVDGEHLKQRLNVLEPGYVQTLLEIFLWLIGGDWRKVPFDDQCRRSSNMAAKAAILDLVSVDYLTNACVDWSNFFCGSLGSSIFTIFHFSLSLIFHPTDNFPLGGHMPCFA